LTAVVYVLDTDQGAEVLRQGPAHPVLGGLIDIGTSAWLDADPPPGPADLAALSSGVAPDRVRVVHHDGPLSPALRAELERAAAQQPVLVAVALPEGAPGGWLLIMAGPDLPAMGQVGGCDPGKLSASLLVALGEPQEDSLFTEPVPGFDDRQEERLSDRLRQLYGE
jgi:hypothetical protein